jgi:hypothetical protein
MLGIALIALGGWDQGLPNLLVAAGGFFVAWGLHRHLARRAGGSRPSVPHFLPDPARLFPKGGRTGRSRTTKAWTPLLGSALTQRSCFACVSERRPGTR